MTIKYSANKILSGDLNEIKNSFKGKMILVFEDGELETSGFETILSRFIWEVNKLYPNIGLKTKHHVRYYMDDELTFKSNTIPNVFATIWNDIVNIYGCTHETQKIVWNMFMDIRDNIINEILMHYQQYHVTINIEDILELMNDKEINEIDNKYPVNKDTVKRNGYVDKIYKEKLKVITSKRLSHNNISSMVKCGTAKSSQLLQSIGPRGVVTDINSDIFSEPIYNGYIRGFDRIYDVAIESRTAAMSLNNQGDPLRFSEYFSRRVQFVGMQLQNLHYTDCGSTNYLTWQVRENIDNSVISDLERLEGMNYLDEETNTIKEIRKTDKHLIGKMIKLRTVLGCQHEDPYGVCSTCCGAISKNVPLFRNLGHFAIVTLTSVISQLILSTKHVTASADSSSIITNDYYNKFITVINNGLAAKLNENFKTRYKEVKISFPLSSINGISDIIETDDVNRLSVKRTSKVSGFTIHLKDKKDIEYVEDIKCISFHDNGFITLDLIKYMKANGWKTIDGSLYIDLKDWNYNLPLIELVSKQFDTYQYSRGIEKLLSLSIKAIKNRGTPLTPQQFLIELIDIVNYKLSINFGIMQLIAYSMLCVDIINGDASLPKPWHKHTVAGMGNIINHRSLSAQLSYQEHSKVLADPKSFLITNRMDSPMDEMFVPEQLLFKNKLEYYSLF